MARRCSGVWLVALCLALVGCGYKTNPRPVAETTPAEVIRISAHAYPDRIVLRWDTPMRNTDGSALQDISGFKVYRASYRSGEDCETCRENKPLHANVDFQNPIAAVIKGGEVTYTDKAISLGNTYLYSVSVYNLKGRESRFSPDLVLALDQAPSAPEGVRVDVDQTGAVLEWTEPPKPQGVEGYRVYRSETEKPEDLRLIGGPQGTETRFIDRTVEKDHTYYYVVRSLKMQGDVPFESEPSPTAKLYVSVVRWSAPENVHIVGLRDGIRVYWDQVKVAGEQTRYHLYRSDSGRLFEMISAEPLVNPWYTDKGVVRGRTYRYAVTAFPQGKPEYESNRSASGAEKFSP